MNRPNPPLPDQLYHYYEAASGPFRSLTHLDPEEAERIQASIRAEGSRFASRRAADYLVIRRELEEKIRAVFVAKGGLPQRDRPHYLILGACEWVKRWYVEGREANIPLSAFSPLAVSFTYGDSFPAMRFQDGRPYRGQVYTLAELPDLVACYGLPQDWNASGSLGPERYIEAQVWEDAPIQAYLRAADAFDAGAFTSGCVPKT
jgi:hypothetical protein